jgi:hypothetical protein
MEERSGLGNTGSKAFQALVEATTFTLIRDNQKCGTGFFLTPNLAITARHNFPNTLPGSVVDADWTGLCQLKISEMAWDTFADYDLMFLEPIDFDSPLCPYIDPDALLRDDCYIYGHIRGRPGPEGVLVSIEESVHDKMRLKGGQIERGFSGAPVVNLRTSGVCGIVVSSRDVTDELGGYCISTAILNRVPNLLTENRKAVSEDGRWIRYSSRPISSLSYIRRISVRPTNYVVRTEVLSSVVERITERIGNGHPTTLVLYGPSGSGKTTIADDIVDELERTLGYNVSRIRCIANPQPVRADSHIVFVDGLNDLSSTPTIKRIWLEQLGAATVRLITTASSEDIPTLRRLFTAKDDPASIWVIEIAPLTEEQTLALTKNTELPCAYDQDRLAQLIYAASSGIPFLVQIALDLACSGELDAVSAISTSSGDEETTRKRLFDAWKRTWLAARPHCDIVAKCLCLGSTIGLSTDAIEFVAKTLNWDCDTSQAVKELGEKGYIAKADIIDGTWIPHQLLRDAYSALTFAEKADNAISTALMMYADFRVYRTSGPIRDLLTIIDVWARGLGKQFERASSRNDFDISKGVPPFVQFSDDLIGRLAQRRADGVTNEGWKRWFASYIQRGIASMHCGTKIALARAYSRVVNPDPFVGDAFLGGWALEFASKPNEPQDAAGEAYALLTSTFCWASGGEDIRARGVEFLKTDLARRRAVPARSLNWTRRVAFVGGFCRLKQFEDALNVVTLSPEYGRPELAALMCLCLLQEQDLAAAKSFANQRGYLLRNVDGLLGVYLQHLAIPAWPKVSSTIDYNPNRIAVLAFASGTRQLEDALYRILKVSRRLDDYEFRASKLDVMKQIAQPL